MVQFNLEKDITEEPSLVCTFTERLDTDNCMQIEDEIYNKVRESKASVVFNLQKVDYISSAFLRICMGIVKEIGAKNLSVINVHPNVKKVFKIAKLDEQINIS